MINENTYERLAREITDRAEQLTLFALTELRKIQNRLIRSLPINERIRLRRLESELEKFIAETEAWMDRELATAYRRGIETAKIPKGAPITAGAFVSSGLLIPDLPSQPISDIAKDVLKDYPSHHTMYGVFRQKADNAFEATRVPILRQHQDRIRELVIASSDSEFLNADTLTRRQLSTAIMRDFADEGVTGVIYSNGRRQSLEAYSELSARSLVMQASNQAGWNRIQEAGQDLIQISQHYPTSDLCEPWQGRAYSLSGMSDKYPSLDTAISGGLFHVNCKHSSSGFTEGISELPDKEMSRAQNREQYEASQQQRYNERQIRSWKRREATAVDPIEREKAKQKVRDWQSRNREHIKENDFLRRKYDREQV